MGPVCLAAYVWRPFAVGVGTGSTGGTRRLCNCIHSEVQAVYPLRGKGAFQLALANGEMLYADQVVLSFGFQGPQPCPSPNPRHSPCYCQSVELQGHGYADNQRPHCPDWYGHTAIDALFRLTSVDPNREVVLLSRHGLLPKAHRTLAQAPLPTGFPSYLQAVPAAAWLLCGRCATKSRAASRPGTTGATCSMSCARTPKPSGKPGRWPSAGGFAGGCGPGGISTATAWHLWRRHAWPKLHTGRVQVRAGGINADGAPRRRGAPDPAANGQRHAAVAASGCRGQLHGP